MRSIGVSVVLALSIAGCADPDTTGEGSATDTADRQLASETAISSADSGARVSACGVLPGDTVSLTDSGIGELKQGRPVAEVRRLCAVVREWTGPGSEGMTERYAAVMIDGETVRATIVDEKVWRIEIEAPRFRTRDLLGVGAPLSRLAAEPRVSFHAGEDGLYAIAPSHCGLSFRFPLPLRSPSGSEWAVAEIARAHGDARVDRVLVSACDR